MVVYVPPCWSLSGPRAATAWGGGHWTGHIRVSLLPSTAEQWKPLNPEEKKRYDREFLLGFQFIFASMQKPEGLPQITDVVLDKVGAVLEIGGAWVVPRVGVWLLFVPCQGRVGIYLLCSGSCCSICNKP